MRLRLAQLDRARREFIANASHELRTPLFSLGGFLELLEDEDLDEETRQEFLETMREQVDRLTQLADRPARPLAARRRPDAGRARAGRPRRGRAARSRRSSRRVAERRDHPLEVDVDGEPVARADEQRVLQIGRALVENALVHTPAGTRVTLRACADGEHACLAVEDDGPGVAGRARAARLRALLPRSTAARLRQRPRACDRARARRR